MMMHLKERGFTLIEMMITMGIALFIMAGMTSVFVSQTRTATMLKNKTEAMGDLFLASQIMQGELRSSKAICKYTSPLVTLVYQPIDSNMSILPCASAAPTSNSVSVKNGFFQYEKYAKNAWHLWWKRPTKHPTNPPKKAKRDELIRGLASVGGMNVKVVSAPPLPDVYEVTLTSQIRGQNNQVSLLPLTFKVWARN